MNIEGASTAERLHTAQLLLGISDRVAGLESLDEILETLVTLTTDQLDAERSTIFLNDERTNELYSRMAKGNITRRIREYSSLVRSSFRKIVLRSASN